MNHTKCKSIYAIRHKESGDFITSNSKCAWQRVANAKSAWNLHIGQHYPDRGSKTLFNNQDEYEVVELLEPFFRLEGLEK